MCQNFSDKCHKLLQQIDTFGSIITSNGLPRGERAIYYDALITKKVLTEE